MPRITDSVIGSTLAFALVLPLLAGLAADAEGVFDASLAAVLDFFACFVLSAILCPRLPRHVPATILLITRKRFVEASASMLKCKARAHKLLASGGRMYGK